MVLTADEFTNDLGQDVATTMVTRRVQKTLRFAQVQGLTTTAVEFVSSPGPRRLLLPRRAIIYKSAGTAYDVANGSRWGIGTTASATMINMSIDPAVFGAGTLLESTTETAFLYHGPSNTGGFVNPFGSLAETNLALRLTQPAGAAITLNGSPVIVVLEYNIVTFPTFVG